MIIISDDLTGAADCGVKFVEEGLSTEIILNSEYNSKAEVKIFCTESRGISLEETKHAVSEVVQNSYFSLLSLSRAWQDCKERHLFFKRSRNSQNGFSKRSSESDHS